MKNRLLLLLVIASAGSLVLPIHAGAQIQQPSIEAYNAGFKAGWSAGWKHVKGSASYPTYAPYPPYPESGTLTFQEGYNNGFVAGMEQAKKEP